MNMYMRMQGYIDNHLNAGPKKEQQEHATKPKKRSEKDHHHRTPLWCSTKASSRVNSKKKEKERGTEAR